MNPTLSRRRCFSKGMGSTHDGGTLITMRIRLASGSGSTASTTSPSKEDEPGNGMTPWSARRTWAHSCMVFRSSELSSRDSLRRLLGGPSSGSRFAHRNRVSARLRESLGFMFNPSSRRRTTNGRNPASRHDRVLGTRWLRGRALRVAVPREAEARRAWSCRR